VPGPFDSFNPNTTCWDANNALALATASKFAYETRLPAPVPPQTLSDVMKAAVQGAGFAVTNFQLLTKDDTQCFVAGDNQQVVVCFRGTENIQNWLTNVQIWLHPFPVGMVHTGFYDALDLVWDDLNAVIEHFQDNAQSLWFTGHSLGASLATLAVARLIFEQHRPINGLYTFGQPRTGNFIFGNGFDTEFEDKTFRFVNNDDLVTRVPPRELGYSHVGQTLFFDEHGVLQNDDHFWNRFLVAVDVGVEGMVNVDSNIAEHNIQLYIDNTQKYVDDVAAGRRAPLTW
jgi:triacylglycerol lipase